MNFDERAALDAKGRMGCAVGSVGLTICPTMGCNFDCPYLGLNTGGDTSAWAKAAVEWAVGAGLFAGNADGSLNPRGEAARAEVAVLLERMVGLIVKE